MKTSQDVLVTVPMFKFAANFEPLIVPKGTELTSKTACGIDPNYHFVNEYQWIKEKYPLLANILTMDVENYGINIPIEFVEF